MVAVERAPGRARPLGPVPEAQALGDDQAVPVTTSPPLRRALRYAAERRRRTLEDLAHLVRIPSVTSDPTRDADVRRAASWGADRLRDIGFEKVSVIRTARHPLVYAQWLRARGRPTVLVYGHLDVQPATKADGWTSDPFRPTLRDGFLYGRGASDDKGQLLCHLVALEAWMRGAGALPVNVKVLLDCEEEIGSPSLPDFLDRNRVALGADAAVISDTRMLASDRPAIAYALRGGLGVEGPGRAAPRDLHK